ncbi:MAG: hypothetical protein ACRDIY_21170, partial [Chloroflexota bacterium]
MEWIFQAIIRLLGGNPEIADADPALDDAGESPLERPWLFSPWQRWPNRRAWGPESVARAVARGAEVARLTLGEALWN